MNIRHLIPALVRLNPGDPFRDCQIKRENFGRRTDPYVDAEEFDAESEPSRTSGDDIRRNYSILLILLMLVSGCFGGAHRLSRSDQAAVTSMMADLRQARVVFVGEFHDQRDHHMLQLGIIRELYGQGTPLSIGLEMFNLEQQPVLDEWVKGKLSLQDFVARYQKGWSINWAEYDSIMLFARNNRIPMIALDAPSDLVKMVTYGGTGALTTEVLKRLPAGVTTSMPPSYRKFMSRAFRTHQIPDGMFDNFCAAQGLRNSTMARLIADHLVPEPERRMVVIAGVGHAMRRAVPAAVAAEGLSTKIVIPRVEGLYDELDGDDMDYFVEE